MNIAVDIGNTRIKCGISSADGTAEINFLDIPAKGKRFDKGSLYRLFHWKLLSDAEVLTKGIYPKPLTWWIAQTGTFPWQELKAEILKVRPHDKFKILTRRHIPLKVDVDASAKVGIDRLLAAFAAVKKFGDVPMLIVDAGSAITIDVVQNQTFCGGAILPGLTSLPELYPKISEKLPLVHFPWTFPLPVYPGKNTEDAILNGLYWGTIGAIRQFYEMRFPRKENARLILTGGDGEYLFSGLAQAIPSRRINHAVGLVWQGIKRCFDEAK